MTHCVSSGPVDGDIRRASGDGGSRAAGHGASRQPAACARQSDDRSIRKRSAGAAERLLGRRTGPRFSRARVRDERSQSRDDVARAGRRRKRRAKGGDRRRPGRGGQGSGADRPAGGRGDRQQVAQSGIDALVTAFIAASSPTVTEVGTGAGVDDSATSGGPAAQYAPGEAPAGAGSPPAPIFSGSNSSGGGMTAVMQSSVSPSRTSM